MPSVQSGPAYPTNSDGLADLHYEVAARFKQSLARLGEALMDTIGEEAAAQAMRAVLVGSNPAAGIRPELYAEFDRLGWREFLDQHEQSIDRIEMTQFWRDGAGYAGQGCSTSERNSRTIRERETQVRALVARAAITLRTSRALFDDDYDYIWKGVAARGAIDFGGTVTLEGLQLLSGLSQAVVRNAASIGDLHPDEAGNVTADEANAWLGRRREFCPSRWKIASDDQHPLDMAAVVTPNSKGMIWVPEAGRGDSFIPDLVVRPARGIAGISVTIGAKGAEVIYHDFYEALAVLAKAEVARWRRRNSVGNWGIVRARGAWVAVSKADIDRQLAAKVAKVVVAS
jgi:hypothetical protein